MGNAILHGVPAATASIAQSVKVFMPTIKISDLDFPCMHPEHNPPNMIVFDPGVYEHTCPACGAKMIFTVTGTFCSTPWKTTIGDRLTGRTKDFESFNLGSNPSPRSRLRKD